MYSYKVLANDPIMGIIFMVVIFEKVGVGLTYLHWKPWGAVFLLALSLQETFKPNLDSNPGN